MMKLRIATGLGFGTLYGDHDRRSGQGESGPG